MRRLLIGTLALAMTFPPLPAQKIDTETPSRERVVRVQTAMNHLTVIEVAEPVATVAVGSAQAFKVERRENKVFIQPLQENVATNLFIWTASTRLNYELVPAVSDAGQMDFAIDLPPAPAAGTGRATEASTGSRRVCRAERNAPQQHASPIGWRSSGREGRPGCADPGRLSQAG